MAYQFPPDIDEWMKSRLATGEYSTEDDVLRAAKHALDEQEEILSDVRQGISDLEAGRYRPLRDVDAELRKKYDIPQDA